MKMRNADRNPSKTLAFIAACLVISPLLNAQETDAGDLPPPVDAWLVATSDGEVIDTSQYTVSQIDDQREVIVLDESSAMVDGIKPSDPSVRDDEAVNASDDIDTYADDQQGPIVVDEPASAIAEKGPMQDLVFGTDDRVQVSSRVYPYSAIVRILTDAGNGFPAFGCTGTLISARVVLTAGHCVFDTAMNKWLPPATVETLLGFNGQALPDSIKVRASSGARYRAPTCFVSGHDRECDVAAIRLDQPVNTARTGVIGWYFNTDNSVWTDGMPYWVSGYPKTVRNALTKAQWSSGGPIMQVTTRTFRTQIDASAGQSGEPLYYKGCAFNCNGPFLIVGVDAHDITINNATKWNEAIRITPWLSNMLAVWAALP